MLNQKTGRSSNRTFTWEVKSTDLAIMQVTGPTHPVAGCSDCGCGIAKLEQRKKKFRPGRSASR